MRQVEALTFDLKGKSAFFKKPDANTLYFTYNNIHKIALLGLLGAVAGFSGRNHQLPDEVYPGFYEKLKGLKICILPDSPKSYFSKKIQSFNNSVGYASREEGGNLIVSEQWLENPSWHIYIMNDGEVAAKDYEKVKLHLLNKECVYPPYLGKNDHPAVIESCSKVLLQPAVCEYFHCLFPADTANIHPYDTWNGSENGFIFKERAPYALSKSYNYYEFRDFIFTSYKLQDSLETEYTYTHEGRNLIFY